jgi:PAS domain S-box-containing protein
VRRDGTEFPAEIGVGMMQMKESPLLMASFRDVTERQRAEARRELLSGVVDSTDSSIITVTLEGIISSWNRGAERLYGYAPSEIIGEPAAVLLPTDHQDETDLRLRSAKRRRQNETLRLAKSGRLIEVLQIVAPIQDSTGRLAGLSIIETDISEQVHAEARFRGLLDAAPYAFVAADNEGRIVFVNSALERLLGYSRETLSGQPAEMLFPDHFRGKYPNVGGFIPAPEGNSSDIEADVRALRKNGEEFPVEIAFGSLETKEGTLVLAAIRDIAVRKMADESVRRSLREKDVMLNETHHRVKNNLQVVSSLLSLQADQVQDPMSRRIFLDSQNRIQSMALIHQQLYTAGNFAEIDFEAYLRSLADHLLASCTSEKFSVRVSIDAAGARLGLAEAIPCGLIVNELISNSLKHSFHGRSSGKIQVNCGLLGGRCTLSVDDDGAPLPDSLLANRSATMGVRLVEALTSQLGGELQTGSDPKFRITFSSQRAAKAASAGCAESSWN